MGSKIVTLAEAVRPIKDGATIAMGGFGIDPTYHTLVSCLDSCQGPGHPPKYPPITWGDYLTQRFDQTYAYRKEAKA